ncbi:hypothetical protein B0156_0632 [Bifidobacterium bifidum]|uniref:hypothetical protein n=1 Tax=Bifidobacterium bifidum TaxID=1681 RepID=UPI000641DEC6|nr:hypothetical protein [Bifidobacterium bifidum]KLN78129.1 hypothetical protein B0156_0632 [Bifidobacterium bifidum]
MAARVEWTAADYAAKEAMERIIDDSALAYRVIAERMGGVVSHVRIGYIHNGEKSPVRLSEFLAICDVCGADPVQTVRDILAEARRIEAERAADEMADRIVANPEQFDVAANDNPNKENEATAPRE